MGASYALKELFYTLQGEGARAGRAAVFARFSGCNLWSGREADRPSAICTFCDTDFVGTDGPGGGLFDDLGALADALRACWDAGAEAPGDAYVVFTGGEPLLQLDAALIEACHARGFEVAVETNGTLAAPEGLDWICVSPKAGAPLVQRSGDELKLVFPQRLGPDELDQLEFRHFFLQPKDDPQRRDHTVATAAWCMAHPRWRLSVQMHKLVGIP